MDRDQWQEAVLNECMAIEGCYIEDDPVKTVRYLIDWHVRNTANWTKGATPPAQADEPVAVSILGKLAMLPNKETLPHGTELYTRPANDKLRKAAQEVWAYFHVADPIDCDEVENLMCKLRAALKGES